MPLNMGATMSSEKSVSYHNNTRNHNTEDFDPKGHLNCHGSWTWVAECLMHCLVTIYQLFLFLPSILEILNSLFESCYKIRGFRFSWRDTTSKSRARTHAHTHASRPLSFWVPLQFHAWSKLLLFYLQVTLHRLHSPCHWWCVRQVTKFRVLWQASKLASQETEDSSACSRSVIILYFVSFTCEIFLQIESS
jgi:hypothetical protein